MVQMYRVLERLRDASLGSLHPANRPYLLTDVSNKCERVSVRVPDLAALIEDYYRLDDIVRADERMMP